jgi:cyclic pyranopterin phosphate synthase
VDVLTDAPLDRFGRGVRDLRLSVTDRCNFRCPYCMPRAVFGPGYDFAAPSALLTTEEQVRLVGVFATLGVTKVRLTGGEPLLRPDLERLVRGIAAVRGIDDIALTTNGSLLASRAMSLREAGLRRVTVSLDSLDPTVFAEMTDSRVPLATVLEGIAASRAAGFDPIKLNAVVRRGVNDDGVLDLARYARRNGHTLRFIEFMDVGTTNGWRSADVVPSAEIVARIAARYPLEPLPPLTPGEVARRWRYADGGGEIGVISSVSEPFCTDCTRARVTATGELFTCLFAAHGRDLRALLRSDADDDALRDAIAGTWSARTDRYSQLRAMRADSPGAGEMPADGRAEMSVLGG